MSDDTFRAADSQEEIDAARARWGFGVDGDEGEERRGDFLFVYECMEYGARWPESLPSGDCDRRSHVLVARAGGDDVRALLEPLLVRRYHEINAFLDDGASESFRWWYKRVDSPEAHVAAMTFDELERDLKHKMWCGGMYLSQCPGTDRGTEKKKPAARDEKIVRQIMREIELSGPMSARKIEDAIGLTHGTAAKILPTIESAEKLPNGRWTLVSARVRDGQIPPDTDTARVSGVSGPRRGPRTADTPDTHTPPKAEDLAAAFADLRKEVAELRRENAELRARVQP